MQELLRRLPAEKEAVPPGGPFLHQEAHALTRAFWGRMVELGADTFWEVFDPADPMRSPYGDPIINSYCHAWSTPVFSFR